MGFDEKSIGYWSEFMVLMRARLKVLVLWSVDEVVYNTPTKKVSLFEDEA